MVGCSRASPSTPWSAGRAQPGMRDAKLVLVCHSMGGLVARWFAEQGRRRRTDPCADPRSERHIEGRSIALTNLVNGLDPGIGPLRLPLTEFVRSFPPSTNCCRSTTVSSRNPVASAWVRGIPWDSTQENAPADAAAFHEAIAGGRNAALRICTRSSASVSRHRQRRRAGTKVVPSAEIDGKNQGGDGTVPVLRRAGRRAGSKKVHEIANEHGELQGAVRSSTWWDGVFRREEIVWQAAARKDLEWKWRTCGRPARKPSLQVAGQENRRLLVTLKDEKDQRVIGPVPAPADGIVFFGRLAEGGYRAVVASGVPGGPSPVNQAFSRDGASRVGAGGPEEADDEEAPMRSHRQRRLREAAHAGPGGVGRRGPEEELSSPSISSRTERSPNFERGALLDRIDEHLGKECVGRRQPLIVVWIGHGDDRSRSHAPNAGSFGRGR